MLELRRIKVWLTAALCFTVSACSATRLPVAESKQHRLHHVAVIWLKKAGNETARTHYIQACQRLAHLPGVVSYDAGMPANVKRSRANRAVDESFDVAVSAVFESREAFEAFLKHPDYVAAAQKELRPLVDKYKVYEFIE